MTQNAEGAITETILDPETGKEIVFTGQNEADLEEAIESYFDPFYAQSEGNTVA